MSRATVLAGVPSENPALYHRVRFGVGDPAAWLKFQDASGLATTQFIVRDIEMERAKASVKADRINCPADFAPLSGLSGDRATATAQAVAECLRRSGVTEAVADRTLPFIYAWHMQRAGIDVLYDEQLGVIDRRVKDDQEIAWLAEVQAATEAAMLMACQTVARASVDAAGLLVHAGAVLTSEILQKMIAEFLLDRGYHCTHGMIVATTPASGDCHEKSTGPLRTGEAVIIDIYPRSAKTRYYGDCTRTVVHGQPNQMILRMHEAVVAAKQAATEATVAEATADSVHQATCDKLGEYGFRFARGQISDEPVLPHGTGHGVGLEVHEPILLDVHGGTLMAGEALTIEPGLYSRRFGGVRVEDMVIVSPSGAPRSLNNLPEGLDWR
jgi:Xaa-Pro aminopeptidase